MSNPLRPGEKRLVRDAALAYAAIVREAMDNDFGARGPAITNELTALVIAGHAASLSRITGEDPHALIARIASRAMEILDITSQPVGRT